MRLAGLGCVQRRQPVLYVQFTVLAAQRSSMDAIGYILLSWILNSTSPKIARI